MIKFTHHSKDSSPSAKKQKKLSHFSITFDSTLSNLFYRNKINRNTSKTELKRETIDLKMRLTPVDYVYLNTTLMLDTNKYKNKYYQPNYYYSFGYDDWHNNTFGFKYSNYQNNLFLDNSNPYASSFLDGTWEIDYKFKLKKINLKLDVSYQPSQNLAIASLSSSFKLAKDTSLYTNYQHYMTYHQNRLEISAKTKLWKKFHLEGGIYLYSDLKLQKNYESDYYYKFQYASEKFSIEYSNQYQNTRWPWRKEQGATFLEGNFKVTFVVSI